MRAAHRRRPPPGAASRFPLHTLQEGRGAPVGATGRSRTTLAAAAALTLALDQASKAAAVAWLGDGRRVGLVGDVLSLHLLRNSGGAFGFMPGAPVLFFLASSLIVAGVWAWGWRSGELPVALGMVAGGGLGNVIDRLFRAPGVLRGRVIDFIDPSFWPTFNLADSAIVLGVAALILSALLARRAKRAQPGPPGPPGPGGP